ncbi:hypothetical protein [Streptomyces tubercidicus]|uniref:hypothetical protein n=1 Tax=Streptomyces tubercidicus TaxID=47759 RepID=UPI003465B72A
MAFIDDFSTGLGAELGVQIDAGTLGGVQEVSDRVGSLEEFLGGLDQENLATLDAVVGAGIDLSTLVDDEGAAVGIPGGALLTIAAAGQLSLTQVASAARTSLVAAQDANPGDTGVA